MPDVAAKAGLSVLLMLFGWLGEGVTKLAQKDYPGAVAAFTKVIEHRGADAPLRRRARVHRAAANGLSGEVDKAKADLAQVLGDNGGAVERAWVFACLADCGVDVSRLLPKESPKDAFLALAKRIETGDLAAVRKRLAGGLAISFEMAQGVMAAHGGDLARELQRLGGEVAYLESTVGTGSEAGTATVALAAWQGRERVVLGMVAVGEEWRFDALLERKPMPPVPATAVVAVAQPADEQRATAEAKAKETLAREMAQQEQIVRALHVHSQQNGGNLPQKLAELAGQLGDQAGILEFNDPATGRKLPRLYRPLGTMEQAAGSSDNLVVATPVAIAGRRVACSLGGRGEEMGDEEFFARARKQGWEPDPERRARQARERKARAEALIVQLGDADGAKRKAAYRELKAMGDEIEPMLEPHRNHPDPEVRMSVRELMKKKPKPVLAVPFEGGMGMIDLFGD